MMKLLRILVMSCSLIAPAISSAQTGYAAFYGVPDPLRLNSFISTTATGNNAFTMNAGAKLCLTNNCSISLANSVSDHVSLAGAGRLIVASLRTPLIFTDSGAAIIVASNVADGASALGITLNNTVTLSTTGAKILSIQNNSSEKNAFDKDGRLFFPTSIGPTWGTPAAITAAIVYDGANRISMSVGGGAIANQWANGNTGTSNNMVSNRTNASGAVGTTINTAVTFNVAGQKLLQILNNAVEKYAWDLNGKALTTFTDTSGTPGSGTANTVCGRSAIAALASAATITNSNVAAASQVFLQMETTGAGVGNIIPNVPGAGSFVATTINAVGAATVVTGTTVFSWCVQN